MPNREAQIPGLPCEMQEQVNPSAIGSSSEGRLGPLPDVRQISPGPSRSRLQLLKLTLGRNGTCACMSSALLSLEVVKAGQLAATLRASWALAQQLKWVLVVLRLSLVTWEFHVLWRLLSVVYSPATELYTECSSEFKVAVRVKLSGCCFKVAIQVSWSAGRSMAFRGVHVIAVHGDVHSSPTGSESR